MPGFKSELCHLLVYDPGEQRSLSEPQFLLLSSRPMTVQPGQGSSSWANNYRRAERAQLLHAGQQSPRLPRGGECWGGSAMAAPPSPTHEEATGPLLQAKNTQQRQGGLLPRNKSHCGIIPQLLAKSGSNKVAVKSKQQLSNVCSTFVLWAGQNYGASPLRARSHAHQPAGGTRLKGGSYLPAQAHAGSAALVLLPICRLLHGPGERRRLNPSERFSLKGEAQPPAGALAGESGGQNSNPSPAMGWPGADSKSDGLCSSLAASTVLLGDSGSNPCSAAWPITQISGSLSLETWKCSHSPPALWEDLWGHDGKVWVSE